MKIEELKIGQTVYVKGIITDIEEDEILDLEIHTSENNFCVNSSDVYVSIDKPKLEVPQFVVEWIEYCKYNSLTLLGAFEPVSEHGIGLANTFTGEVRKGIDWAKRNQDIFARAWLAYPNITVEKEKLYKIIDKRLDVTFNCLGYVIEDGVWFWANKKAFLNNENVRLDHTQQQLIDAGFEEVFENPNYEVKEVTE